MQFSMEIRLWVLLFNDFLISKFSAIGIYYIYNWENYKSNFIKARVSITMDALFPEYYYCQISWILLLPNILCT